MSFSFSKDKVCSWLCAFVIFLWTCLPASVNEKFAFTVNNTNLKLNIWLGGVILVVCILSMRRLYLFRSVSIYVCYLFYTAISGCIFIALDDYKTPDMLIEAFLVLLLPFLLLNIFINIKSPKSKKLIINAFILSGMFLTIQVLFFGLIKQSFGWQYDLERAFTTMGMATVTADYLYSVFAILLLLILKEHKKIYWYLIGVVLIAELLLETRTSLIMIFLLLSFLIVCLNTSKKIKMIGVLLAVFTISMAFMGDVYETIFLRFFTDKSSVSDEGRQEFMTAAIEYFKAHILFGGGDGLVIDRNARLVKLSTTLSGAHSQWVTTLAEQGIVGASFLASYIVGLLFDYQHQHRLVNRIAAASFIILVLVGFNLEALFSGDIRVTLSFWIFPMMFNYFYFLGEEDPVDRAIE